MKLYIGNKNYSSWSFRPWIAMKAKAIEFEEILIPFDDDARNPKFKEFSPTGKVPTLVDGELTIWESLAILEYLAERFPEKGLWPVETNSRAHARCIANEMHSGFHGLRSQCPMNIRRNQKAVTATQELGRDVARIETIWDQCLKQYGGPFLFGDFTIADAMYAPVVNRLEVYALSNHDAVKSYSHEMKSHPAWIEWQTQALAEPWIVPADEV